MLHLYHFHTPAGTSPPIDVHHQFQEIGYIKLNISETILNWCTLPLFINSANCEASHTACICTCSYISHPNIIFLVKNDLRIFWILPTAKVYPVYLKLSISLPNSMLVWIRPFVSMMMRNSSGVSLFTMGKYNIWLMTVLFCLPNGVREKIPDREFTHYCWYCLPN